MDLGDHLGLLHLEHGSWLQLPRWHLEVNIYFRERERQHRERENRERERERTESKRGRAREREREREKCIGNYTLKVLYTIPAP